MKKNKKSNKNNQDTLFWVLEEYSPYALGILGTVLMGYCSIGDKIINSDSFEIILDSTITFSSIAVGFVGALLGILFSIRHTETINLLFKKKEKDTLKKYFKQNIISGIMLVFISMTLYIKDEIDSVLIDKVRLIEPSIVLAAIWGFLLAYTLSSTYRITSIMMHIIFSSDDESKNKEPKPIKMDEESKNKLKNKYTK